MFIVFEWLDWSGSSTQSRLLAKYLISKEKEVTETKEPTDNILWKLARQVLQHKVVLSSDSLQLLFCADRAEHLSSKVLPSLEKWNIVISDRYYFSTIAFWSLNADTGWLEQINAKFLKPDIIFLFKLDPKECIKRIQKRWSDIELFEKSQILEKVWKTYDYLYQKHDNCILIDASSSIDQIHSEIVSHIDKKI